MSSETIVTAIFLITAIVAAGILTSQIFPAIYTMSSTFSSSSSKADQQMRTDMVIVNSFADSAGNAQVWLKDTGTSRIYLKDLNMSTLFIGAPGDFEALSQDDLVGAPPAAGKWSYDILDNSNAYWDEGETLHLMMKSDHLPTSRGDVVYFQMVLFDGTKRSEQFTVS
ncbi:MAG TPA: flagellin [Methanomicrobiales archaeon]|nr:flagellin [Methanomicrobiales archaeon]